MLGGCVPNQQNNTHDNADQVVNVDKLDEHITIEECRKAIYKAKKQECCWYRLSVE